MPCYHATFYHAHIPSPSSKKPNTSSRVALRYVTLRPSPLSNPTTCIKIRMPRNPKRQHYIHNHSPLSLGIKANLLPHPLINPRIPPLAEKRPLLIVISHLNQHGRLPNPKPVGHLQHPAPEEIPLAQRHSQRAPRDE
jgi:hypothetical protein